MLNRILEMRIDARWWYWRALLCLKVVVISAVLLSRAGTPIAVLWGCVAALWLLSAVTAASLVLISFSIGGSDADRR
jgi:hypothetical protein